MILLPLLAALAVIAPSPKAQDGAEEGVAAFAEGRYEDAARILERAYASKAEPELLFAWAQAERYAGHCDVAVPLFREFLTGQPAADVRALAREAVEACGEDPDAPTPEPEQTEVLDPAEPEPEPEPEPEARPPSGAARDPWGHALTWSGVVTVGVGAGLLGEAHRRRLEGDRASDEQGYRDALAGAPTLSRAGIAVLAGGGALLAAGVIRFAVVGARSRREHAELAERVRLRPSGMGLQWAFELAPRRQRVLP